MMIHFQAHMIIMFFIFFFLGASAMAEAGPRNPLVDLSTPDELLSLAGYGEEKLSTVIVGGTLHCDTYFNRKSISHPISGALVAVSCDNNKKRSKSNWVRGKTDEYGDFLIDLPSHLHAISNMEKRCVVRIVHLPKISPCHRRFTSKHIRIKLTSSGNGIRTYSTDEIHLGHKQQHSQPSKNIRSKGIRKTAQHML
ncbi:unnamed protein product [Lactuca virosa]|uniref:Pollen Ole e 1 allergen and extensin family protein n=1 Tax=Lactuca virosa TaxID=75947 RepID=A0AAU9PDA4_9ASTR|nr:unnamed protein product [Lactuca virosa]